MDKKSMIDVAYDVINDGSKVYTFKELYEEVAKILEMDDASKAKNIGIFYTQLTVDGRFLSLGNNTWDLKIRHAYAVCHDDSVNLAYTQIDEESANKDQEDEEDEKEYNAAIEGKEEPIVSEKENSESEDTPSDGEDDEESSNLDTNDLLKSI